MDGVEKYFQQGKFKELYTLLRKFLGDKDGKGGAAKVDGAPAIVMWSEFPGMDGPGVSYKAIITQAKRGSPKCVFTNPSQMDNTTNWASGLEDGGKKNRVLNRADSFKLALKHLSPCIKPGIMVWGDVLFTPGIKQEKDGKVICTPNTLTYEFDTDAFPEAKDAEFGIYLHTAIDEDFNTTSIHDANNVLVEKPSGAFVLSSIDMKPQVNNLEGFKTRLEELNDMAMEIAPQFTPNIGHDIDRAIKTGVDISDEIMSDKKNKDIDGDYAELVESAYLGYFQLKENLLANCSIPNVNTYMDGERTDGEGYVVSQGSSAMKLVSKKFTKSNLDSHHKQKMMESVEGDNLIVWSSSKDSNLFNLYIKKMLTFGNSGGSNYGFASYAVIEPPFSDKAEIGYSKEFRAKIYGDNIFEFKVPTTKVLFLLFDEYRKTRQGRNAKFATFVRDQVKRMGLDFTDEEIAYITPDKTEENTATQAMRLYKLCSRKYYQKKDGTLNSPFAGFVYKGRMDGKVYVGWNPYALEPVRMSNDAGKTWSEVDRSDPEFVEYLKGEQGGGEDDTSGIFDGNKTEEKEKVYRLLMKYNSNDGVDADGKEYRMSDGVFYDIVIKDDKTIDAKYKSNLPIIDHYDHYYRPSQNEFMQEIANMGYRLGHLDCGLKIGAETKDYPWTCYNVPPELLPMQVDGGLKLSTMKLDKPIKLKCKFGSKRLVLVKCELAKDLFDNYDVVLTKNEKKLNWVSKPEVKQELVDKYDWAKPELILDEDPAKNKKPRRTKKATK